MQRQGAGAVYLSVFHPDIIDFLSTKKENADEKVRVKTLSLGVVVPDKFYELAKNDEDMYLFSPYDVEREYNIPFSEVDITKEYDNLLENENIQKYKIRARDLENEISKLQQESGYPYILNVDTANRENPIPGKIVMSNLCVTGDTELLTEDGYFTAKELFEKGNDLKVVIDNRTKNLKLDEKGSTVVDAIPMQLTAKQAKIFEINTMQGFRIKSTEWHKYYVKEKDGISKKQLNELKVGDRLLVQSSEGSYGKNHDPELAYVMGIIAGDGSMLTMKNGKDENAVVYLYGEKSVYKDDIESKIKNIIKKYYKGGITKHNATLEPKFNLKHQNEMEVFKLSSSFLGTVLNSFGFNKNTKTEVIKWIKNSDKETQSAYLSGLFKMDGSVNTNLKYKTASIELVTNNSSFAENIQKLLLNMGIYSSIVRRNKRKAVMPSNVLNEDGEMIYKEYECKSTHRISIMDRFARDTFAENIELKEKDINKLNEFNKHLKPVSRKPKHDFTTEIISIEEVGIEDVYDTTQEDFHSLIFNGIATGNCSEILQSMKTSEFNEDLSYKKVGEDISCNLGSTNMVGMMKSGENFGKSVANAVRALTFITDDADIQLVPSVANGNKNNHTIGLGAMGFHTVLALNEIDYESEEAIEFSGLYFYLLNYYSLKESNKIAIERNQSFKSFKESDYYNGKYFDKYLENDFSPKLDKVKEAFKDIYIPTKEDWIKLKESIRLGGLYHAYRLALAPTGSISYVNETSASLHPITQLIEERNEKSTGKTYYPAPYLSNKTIKYYKSAYDIDMRWVIDVYAEAQKHVDQGMSLTLFLREDMIEGMYEWKESSNEGSLKQTTRDLNILRNYAHQKGIKTIYYIRTYREGNQEASANECESCSI